MTAADRIVAEVLEHVGAVPRTAAELCRICGEELDPVRVLAPHLGGLVCLNCVPAIVRNAGPAAVREWRFFGTAPPSNSCAVNDAQLYPQTNPLDPRAGEEPCP